MPAYGPDGRSDQLSHTALPLRHRLYALYCEGRSFTALARIFRLDRGTVARHIHAIEATLLAEQSPTSLAQLRLRAIEAQHAILAAAWDALKFEEAQERDYEEQRETDRVQDGHYTALPGRSRRAQLLSIAARAARTAAQLQGLFTPAALTAALQSLGAPEALPAETPDLAAPCGMLVSTDAAPLSTTSSIAPPSASTGLPPQFNCGAPASPPSRPTGLPREFNSRACLTTPPAPAVDAPAVDALTADPAASRGMLASTTPPTGTGLPPRFNCGAPALTTSSAPRDYPANSIRGLAPTTPLATCANSARALPARVLPM
jgi:hypothetical protein